MSQTNKITMIGAGLAGSLLAIYLAKRGLNVSVFEARGDMRKAEVVAGRSINLALSDRGIAALREVGMDDYMLAEAIPMHGRMIHTVSGETKLLPYSGRKGEYINSISRGGLNIALINAAEKYRNVQFILNEKCVGFDCRSGEAEFESGRTIRADTLFATDGAGSKVRLAMEKQIAGFDSSSVFLDHGYKELHIPQRNADTLVRNGRDAFAMEPNALHIWPRNKFMMIALPNFDGSFTCTLFLAKSDNASAGDTSFDQLTDESAVLKFFEREFPDALPLMPTLVDDFFTNPTGDLGTLKCWPWNVEGKALLLGDSAHAMVPFYGQGMNCAFEDVRAFAGLIDKQMSEPEAIATGSHQNIEWRSIFEEYSALRKINTDAIQDMAEENFYEMRDAVADPVFQRKRELETKLEQTYPDYFSKYSMVTFREDMPYSEAKRRGNEQDAMLMEICSKVSDVHYIDTQEVMKKLTEIK